MATQVKEVMNRELFSLRPDDSAEDALRGILALGITGAPVVESTGCPIGMVSLRDLMGRRESDSVADRMHAPAACISCEASLEEAGGTLAATGYHRLVVVDAAGAVVGIASALDIVRGLLGLPAVHPAPFPHLDPQHGLVWTDDQPLEPARSALAPARPGLLVLVHGGAGRPERVVWAEAAENLQGRLGELLAEPRSQDPLLGWWLERGGLRFRIATSDEGERRRHALGGLLRQAHLPPRPSWI